MPARLLCLTGGPRLSAPTSAPSLPPLSRCIVGQASRRRPLSRAPASLSVPPSPPVSLSSTSHPLSSRRGCAHDRAFPGHVRAPTPLLSLAPCSPTSPLSFAPSAQPSRPLCRSAHVCRELHHRPPSTAACSVEPSRPCPVQCHSELRLTVSCSGHPSVCPFLPCYVRSTLTGAFLAQPEAHRRRPEVPSHPRCSPSVSEFALEVSTLPMPLFRQVSP